MERDRLFEIIAAAELLRATSIQSVLGFSVGMVAMARPCLKLGGEAWHDRIAARR